MNPGNQFGGALFVPFPILSWPAPCNYGLMHIAKIIEGKEETTLAYVFVPL